MGLVQGVDAHPRGLVGVPRRDIAGDFRAFVEVAPYGQIGGGRADPVRLLESAITTIEACHDLAPPLAARRLGVDERLHLVAPLRAVVGAADRAQIVQGAEDLTQSRKIAIKGRRRLALRASRHGETKENRGDGEQLFHGNSRCKLKICADTTPCARHTDQLSEETSAAAASMISARPSVVL